MNTPTISTSYNVQSNPNNYCAYGMALLDYGLCQIVQTNGIGLVTNGFIWQGPEIWFYVQDSYSLNTVWTPAYGYAGNATFVISTTWTPAYGYAGNATFVISTTWVPSQSFGNEFPE